MGLDDVDRVGQRRGAHGEEWDLPVGELALGSQLGLEPAGAPFLRREGAVLESNLPIVQS